MEGFITAIRPSILTILFAVPLLYGLYLKKMGKLTNEKLCGLLLIAGLVLRLCYITYTDENTRQHDVGQFYENNNYHSGYILYLMKQHHLPDFDPRDRWQFYHPPLYHTICAIILTIVDKLGFDHAQEGPRVLQFFTVAYSTLFSVFAYKSFKKLGIKDNGLVLATAIAAFHPTLIILSGSINNDILAALFQMLALYFTLCWARERKWYQILLIALSVGFGMMTKLTVGLLAPAIAAVFLTVLIKQRRKWKSLVPQFFLFGFVCIPIGMFWPVRNLIKFGMPLTYIARVSEDSGQYIDIAPFKRLTDWSLYQFASPFTQWKWHDRPYNEFNPIIALLKNAMFDEETFFKKSITLQSFCTTLFFAGSIVAVLSVVAVARLWKKREKLPLEDKLLLTITFAVIFGNYISFCLGFPQVCTQNMRYCVPLIFAGGASLGLMINRFKETKNALARTVRKAACMSVTAMCSLSAFVYIAMMFYDIAE